MRSEQRDQVLTALAQRLASAWAVAGVTETPSGDEVPKDRSDAYFIQDKMAGFIGEPTTGWKIGGTNATMRALEGHDDILPGRLFPSVTHYGTQLSIRIGDCPNPRVEAEFGFRLNADMPLRDQPWDASEIAPMVTLYPSLEVIGNRFVRPDAPASTLSLLGIADNGGGIGGVFGDPIKDWQDIDFHQYPVSVVMGDGTAAEGLLGDLRGDPMQAIADLANLLAARELSLHAGDMLLTGTLNIPQPVTPGSHLVADFGGLGRLELSFT